MSRWVLALAAVGFALVPARAADPQPTVAYSPDGKTLVTGNNLGRIQAWDAERLRNP